jgi:aspartate/tyrosine/aromatic aminotransferase
MVFKISRLKVMTSSYCYNKVEIFRLFYSDKKVWLGSETWQGHKEVSEVVGKRQQITVKSFHWLYGAVNETKDS